MHILLTDILSCPRCVQESGLILLADRVQSRRVIEGTLGCPSCRAQFSVRSGVADLRDVIDASLTSGEAHAEGVREPVERAMRWAALMGVAEGPGFLLLLGEPAAAHASAIAGMIEGVEVVADVPDHVAETNAPSDTPVSRMRVGGRLPFYGGRVRGISLSGALAGGQLLEEAARVLAPGGRLVVEPAPDDAGQRLARAGLRVLAREHETLVAARG